jgi:hypothetical protein
MSQKLGQLFKNIRESEPPSNLKSGILAAIKKEKGKIMRRKLVLSYTGIIISVVALLYAMIDFGGLILQSEFWSLLTLMATDAQVVLGDWNTYLLSLLETFPVTSAIIILIPIFTLMLSFISYFKLNEKKNFNNWNFA